MARNRDAVTHKQRGGVSARARAVMKAFRLAKNSAPKFMSSCGIFPEVSDSASDRLHSIVHELAMRQLDKGRHIRALNKRLKQLSAPRRTKQAQADLMEGIGNELTAVLASEATAAYLFGLSVGMTVRTLPERLDR